MLAEFLHAQRACTSTVSAGYNPETLLTVRVVPTARTPRNITNQRATTSRMFAQALASSRKFALPSRSCVNPSGVSEARPSVRCSAHRARLRGGYALARVGASYREFFEAITRALCPRARRGLQKPAKRCSPSMAHGALYARYSPATVAEAPAGFCAGPLTASRSRDVTAPAW